MKKMDPVVIGFYKNGLIIQGFPFYPYSSKEAQVRELDKFLVIYYIRKF